MIKVPIVILLAIFVANAKILKDDEKPNYVLALAIVRGTYSHLSEGVLISKRFVVSSRMAYFATHVTIGLENLSDAYNKTHHRIIEEVTTFSSRAYHGDNSGLQIITLLRMKNELFVAELGIRPAKLAYTATVKEATVIGWSTLGETSNTIQSRRGVVLTEMQCEQKFRDACTLPYKYNKFSICIDDATGDGFGMYGGVVEVAKRTVGGFLHFARDFKGCPTIVTTYGPYKEFLEFHSVQVDWTYVHV